MKEVRFTKSVPLHKYVKLLKHSNCKQKIIFTAAHASTYLKQYIIELSP